MALLSKPKRIKRDEIESMFHHADIDPTRPEIAEYVADEMAGMNPVDAFTASIRLLRRLENFGLIEIKEHCTRRPSE